MPIEVSENGGLIDPAHPALQATLRGAVIHKKPPYGPPKVTVTFTIGEPGKAPGTGITFGSYFQMLLFDRAGRPSSPMVAAAGAHGRYSATTYLPPGGIGSIQIGGWLNYPTGPPTARDGYVIPVKITAGNA